MLEEGELCDFVGVVVVVVVALVAVVVFVVVVEDFAGSVVGAGGPLVRAVFG